MSDSPNADEEIVQNASSNEDAIMPLLVPASI